ncbi:hypothetical protein H0H92_011838 [Tricholoma furcatifolium]|nr:hypothetical protein H0H92_011838 [Tricholoma furcatifolium]
MRLKYGFLLENFTETNTIPVFRTESQDRMLHSALNFGIGFFGYPLEGKYQQSITIEADGFNNTLAPYDTAFGPFPDGPTICPTLFLAFSHLNAMQQNDMRSKQAQGHQRMTIDNNSHPNGPKLFKYVNDATTIEQSIDVGAIEQSIDTLAKKVSTAADIEHYFTEKEPNTTPNTPKRHCKACKENGRLVTYSHTTSNTTMRGHAEIPHRSKLRTAIIEQWQLGFSQLKQELQTALSLPNYTMDIWSAQNRKSYLAVTSHHLEYTQTFVMNRSQPLLSQV